jgi:hypothetical protein
MPKRFGPSAGELGPMFRNAGKGTRHNTSCGFAGPPRQLNSVLISPILDFSIVTVLLPGEVQWLKAPNLKSCLMRLRQAVDREFAAFEQLENDFNARERKERAAKLG